MKNFLKLIGIIAVIAIAGLPVMSCTRTTPSGETNNTQSQSGTANQTQNVIIPGQGVLTISGLDSYNGYYAYAEGYTREDTNIIAAVDITGVMNMVFMTGAEIVNGSVTLPVWRITGYGYDEEDNTVINKVDYSGSDFVEFSITIWGGSESYSWQSMGSIYNQAAGGFFSVTFNNGRASGVVELPDYSGYSIFER